MLSLDEFIIAVFCIVDDWYTLFTKTHRLRCSGPSPALSDPEVLTMEIVGEFLGYDTDKGLWRYFHLHWRHFFPALPCRTSFLRQAANLYALKQRLLQDLATLMGADTDPIHIIDGSPIKLCNIKRALRCRLFRGLAAFGYCAAKDEYFFGFRGHLVISLAGIITAFTLTPANTDERDAAYDVVQRLRGLLLGDKGYIRPLLSQDLGAQGIVLQTPLRSNMDDPRPLKVRRLFGSVRRKIETVIGQLAEQFHLERVRARELWHLTSRITRKLLAHTLGIFLNFKHHNEPLQLEALLAST